MKTRSSLSFQRRYVFPNNLASLQVAYIEKLKSRTSKPFKEEGGTMSDWFSNLYVSNLA